jgi:hypothetical protein
MPSAIEIDVSKSTMKYGFDGAGQSLGSGELHSGIWAIAQDGIVETPTNPIALSAAVRAAR